MDMKKSLKNSLIIILLLISSYTYAQNNLYNRQIDAKLLFKAEMSRLWIDNAIWSRQSTLCLTDKLLGTQESLYRLMMNQEEMGRIFTRYYGKTAGDEFCELISSNTSITISIIRHMNNKNTDDLEKARQRMKHNVLRASAYLAKMNPYWNKEELDYLLLLQLELFEKQLQHRLTNNYTSDVENFDRIITESYKLSDVLSEGIIKQFSDKFQ